MALVMVIGKALQLVWNHLIGVLFFYLGWPFVKLFSFGKYPIKSNVFKESSRESLLVTCVGLIVLTIIILIFYYAK